jgi:hypothetical protein
VPAVPPATLGAGLVPYAGLAGWQIFDQLDPPADRWPDWSNAVLGDLDDDGTLEVVLQSVQPAPVLAPSNRPVVFTVDPTSRTLAHDPAASAELDGDVGAVIALVDLDGDGDTDVLKANRDAAIGTRTDAGLVWTPAGVSLSGLDAPALTDVDGDGWLDVVLGADPCNLPDDAHVQMLPILRTPEGWSARPDLVDQLPAGDAYALLAAPLGPDRTPTLMSIGRGCNHLDSSHTFWTVQGRDADQYPTWSPTTVLAPNNLLVGPTDPVGQLSRHSPMGGAVADLDLDGHVDFVVALSETWLHVYGGTATGALEERTLDAAIRNPDGNLGNPELPWAVTPTDLDRDGWPDLTVAYGDDAGSHGNGPYPVRVFWNDHVGTYVDVTSMAGLGELGSWHSLQWVDLDGDAAPELAVSGPGTMPVLYANDVDTPHGALALRLEGTTSNHLGMGASVQVDATGLPPQLRVMGEYGSPKNVPDRTLFYGLGAAEQATVTVTWPSGTVQTVVVTPGTHTITEPEVLSLSVPSREVPADGVSTVDIVVRPVDATGAPRAAAVAVDLLGPGTFAGPVVQDGDAYRRTLVAPGAAGSSVVTVTLDGEPLGVAPRVWWR